MTEARQGDERGANAVLQQLERTAPDHPAVLWGRNALRALVAKATRSRSRPTPSDWPSAVVDAGVDDAARARTPSTPLASIETATRETTSDPASAALERFGARVALRPAAEVAREARMLRAFSAGGSLAAATTPEQAHAARIVLTTFLTVAANEHGEVPSPVRTMVEQVRRSCSVVGPMRPIVWCDAECHGTRTHWPTAAGRRARCRIGGRTRWRDAVRCGRNWRIGRRCDRRDPAGGGSRGTDARCWNDGREDTPADACVSAPSLRHTPFRGVPVLGELLVRDAVDRGPVVPIRLGLSLLEETAGQRAALQGASGAWPAMVSNSPRDLTEIFPTSGESNGAPRNPESKGAGWGAAHAAADPRIGGRMVRRRRRTYCRAPLRRAGDGVVGDGPRGDRHRARHWRGLDGTSKERESPDARHPARAAGRSRLRAAGRAFTRRRPQRLCSRTATSG